MDDGDKDNAKLTSYATVEELQTVWKQLSSEETARAEALLLQASNYLRQIAANNQVSLDDRIEADSTGLLLENVKMVVMNAVQRIMSAPADMPADATQYTQSATPYSESFGFSGGATPSSIFFKTKELELLGLGPISGKSQISILRGVR